MKRNSALHSITFGPKSTTIYNTNVMEQLQYYIGIIAFIVIGVLVVKKVASCLIRFIILLVMLVALAIVANAIGWI